MRLHGLEARHGDTAFAFLVLRFRAALDRDAIAVVIEKIAPIIPDASAFIAELPEDLNQAMRIVGMPWMPADVDDAVEEQRALLALIAGEVDDVWFFQAGTSLPAQPDDADEEVTRTKGIIVEDRAETEVDDGEPEWSDGAPPQVSSVRFPVDGYPEILEDHDWEDFGIAIKLAGDWQPGESTVLLGFHALWLAPYGNRYRNAAVTIDQPHHAAHLWVDRFSVPCSVELQVHHLLWILSKLDEVTPIVHARFVGASMQQKYGGLMGDNSDPFVLGGNPLLDVHAHDGEAGVDRWIASQRDWSTAEVAQMLRELAIDLVTGDDPEDAVEDEAPEPEVASDGKRNITQLAASVLAARGNRLDPRALAALRPLLAVPEKYEHRRTAVVEILGAARDRASLPALMQIVETTPITSSLDSIGKEGLLCKVADALGVIADPSAAPALVELVRATGAHNDKPRAPAAFALAACGATVNPPVLDALLAAELFVPCGLLATSLTAPQRARLSDGAPTLPRLAAVAIAGGASDPSLPSRLHAALTSIGYSHEQTVRDVKAALQIAEALPALVAPDDLVWLIRFAEPDIRASAHAILAARGRPLPKAPTFDRLSVRALSDDDVTRSIAEPHVVGRAALIAEAGRRGLRGARAAIIAAADAAIARARPASANLLDPDAAILLSAVSALRAAPLDAETVGLFDRMLRHSNHHVKWELLQSPPKDERLIGGMFHVAGEKWGWQEKTAKTWLAGFQGSPAYEAERRRDDMN